VNEAIYRGKRSTMHYWEEYDRFEDALLEGLRGHPCFEAMPLWPVGVYREYLGQASFLARNFERFTLFLKACLQSVEVNAVLGPILQEEIPRNRPTHKDLLLTDLRAAGLTPKEISLLKPTRITQESLELMDALVGYSLSQHAAWRPLAGLVCHRVCSEVSVPTQYGHIVSENQRRFGIPASGGFYADHRDHDAKRQGHGELSVPYISARLRSERALAVAKEAAERAIGVRMHFHSQF
jgi:hypothetical protein